MMGTEKGGRHWAETTGTSRERQGPLNTRTTYVMTRLAIAAIVATAALLHASSRARAGSLEDCLQAEAPIRQVSGCTAVIQSERQTASNLVWAFHNRGFAYHVLGEFRKAIDDYDQALRLNPNIAKFYNSRGGAFGNLRQFRKAIEDFDRAIRLDPDYVDAYYNRGEAYRGLGEIRKAIRDYDRTISLRSGDAGAYHRRGMAYEAIGDFKRAVKDWETAMEIAGAPRVRRWQAYLRKAGYYSGALDGNYDARTRIGLVACARDPAC